MKTVKLFAVILLAIFVTTSSFAQNVNLPRKALIGIGLAPLTQDTAEKNKIKINEGVSISIVAPNSTANALGLQVGDIITKLNGVKIDSPQKMAQIAGKFVEEEEFTIELISNGKKQTKKGKAIGRPKESTPYSEVHYDAVEYKLGKLRTIVHKPKGRTGKLPAIFFMQGYPCQSQEFIPNFEAPMKKLLIDWVKAGYVVYRVERPNIGDSSTTKDCRDINFDEEVAGNLAAYKSLLKYDFVDKDNVFLFGHSLGSNVAPFLTEPQNPKGIIVYGGLIRSWFEYFIDIFRIQSTYFGTSKISAETNARNYIPAVYAWLEEGKSPEEMKKDPKLKAILEAPGNPLGVSGKYFFGRDYNFWHTMNKKRMTKAWSKVKSNVLALHGEFDVQAISDRDAQNIAEVVNEANPGKGKYLLIPKADHGFVKAESHKQIISVMNSGQMPIYMQQNYNADIAIKTIEWMSEVRKP